MIILTNEHGNLVTIASAQKQNSQGFQLMGMTKLFKQIVSTLLLLFTFLYSA